MNHDSSTAKKTDTANDVGSDGASKTEMINITVNGKPMDLQDGSTIKDLLKQLEINTRAVAVEINQELQPKAVHDQRIVECGDQLEIVTLVGGG